MSQGNVTNLLPSTIPLQNFQMESNTAYERLFHIAFPVNQMRTSIIIFGTHAQTFPIQYCSPLSVKEMSLEPN